MSQYKYLVVAALQEELNEFIKLTNPTTKRLDLGVESLSINGSKEGKFIDILTFTVNKMGMPANAASIMQVISKYNPKFTFFIGTCAGLRDHKLGTVLVPFRVFSYESGKLERGVFYPDYFSYETGEFLRKNAEILWDKIKESSEYEVVTDEDFCSGSAVINDEEKVKEIVAHGARKLSGLEMEAYSIAYINHALKPHNELLVIKGISDYGINKEGNDKELAKKNCADFTLKLIHHLEEKDGNNETQTEDLEIHFEPTYNKDATYKLKVMIRIKNISSYPIIIESKLFSINSKLRLDPAASSSLSKPTFLIRRDLKPLQEIKKITETESIKIQDIATDIYEDICLVKPYESVMSCWLPIDPQTTIDGLRKAMKSNELGIWTLRYYLISNQMYPITRVINM